MPTEVSARNREASSAGPPSQLVRDVMRRDFITITRDESLVEALQLMRLARLRHLAVVSDGVLVGVLSYRDLQDQLVAHLDLDSQAADDPGGAEIGLAARMIEAPFSIAPGATLSEAASRLDRLRVGCLPVVEPDAKGLRLVGLLTEMDLLRAAFEL